MSRTLRILLADDSADNAQRIQRALRETGMEANLERVQSPDAFAKALRREPWDAVLADYTLTDFSAMQALEILRTQGLDLPLIIVSGHIGETTAVQAIKAGAHDHVLKDDLARLAPALERELTNAAHRRERVRAEEACIRIETQVRQVQKAEAIRALAGGIAHDFNNILAAILGHAELLQGDLEPEHPGHESLSEILVASLRAKDLVQQILLLSRRREQGRKVLALAPVLHEALRLLRATLPATIEIRAEIPPADTFVLADPAQVHQVIVNLGTNAARRLREPGGRIELRLEVVTVDEELTRRCAQLHPGPYARIVIRDTGPVLEGASLERVFDLSPSSRPATEGAGLSLAVVHGIVQSHAGAILVENQPGRGLAVQLYFPAVKGEAVPLPAPATEIPRGQGEHILLVDDEEAIARLAVTLLERLGYRVTAVTSPAEAMAVFREDPAAVDVVITDLTMPQMSGTELARNLREIRPDLPIVLATGYSDALEPGQIQAAGIRELVGKPFQQYTLAEAVQRACRGTLVAP